MLFGDGTFPIWTVYLKAVETWEEPGPGTRSALQTVSTDGSVERALSQAVDALRRWDLSDLDRLPEGRGNLGRTRPGDAVGPADRLYRRERGTCTVPGGRCSSAMGPFRSGPST